MKQYIINILTWIDQGANVLLAPLLNLMLNNSSRRFGDPDETLSSVFGKNRNNCKICSWVCFVLNYVFFWQDFDHCNWAIEKDEGRRGLK